MRESVAMDIQMLVRAGVLEHIDSRRFNDANRRNPLFLGNCTGTFCADGARLGDKLQRTRKECGAESMHVLTSHGGTLEFLPRSPVLVAAGWSDAEIALFLQRSLQDIHDARHLLRKGDPHIASHHFPCGAARRARLSVFEQCQLYYTAVKYMMQELDYLRSHLLCITHVDWGDLATTYNSGERFALYIFKKSAWCRFTNHSGIPPHLDVDKYNKERLSDVRASAPRFNVHTTFIPEPHQKEGCSCK